MASKSKIEWTDASWNPFYGCHKVSSGCKNCYMFRDMRRYGNDPNVVRRASAKTFSAPLRWEIKGSLLPGSKIFTCSWSDWFIEEADAWRDEAWAIIKATPRFNYLILTKRPENILSRLPNDWMHGWPNVWLGISAENQLSLEARLFHFLSVPAITKFISCEPLLESLNLDPFFTVEQSLDNPAHLWVITGGESGPNARPMNIEWARLIRNQCKEAGMPFFMKQLSQHQNPQFKDFNSFPRDLRIREYPK